MIYKITCIARPEDTPAWAIFTAEETNKAKAQRLYETYRVKRYVQGIILRNLSTGEVLRAEITGNRITGHRTERTVLR